MTNMLDKLSQGTRDFISKFPGDDKVSFIIRGDLKTGWAINKDGRMDLPPDDVRVLVGNVKNSVIDVSSFIMPPLPEKVAKAIRSEMEANDDV